MHMRQDRGNKGPLAYKATRIMWDDNIKWTPPKRMGKKDGMNCKCPHTHTHIMHKRRLKWNIMYPPPRLEPGKLWHGLSKNQGAVG